MNLTARRPWRAQPLSVIWPWSHHVHRVPRFATPLASSVASSRTGFQDLEATAAEMTTNTAPLTVVVAASISTAAPVAR
jgi:hypothetical protein